MLRNNNLSCRSVEVECLSKSVVSSSCWLHHPVDYCRGFGGLFCVVCCCVSYVSQFLTCRGGTDGKTGNHSYADEKVLHV